MPAVLSHAVTRRSLAAGTLALGAVSLLGRAAHARHQAAASPEASPAADAPTLLLRMETVGGPDAPERRITAVPDFSLFSDGAIYRLGPVIAIFPPPALPNVTRMRVSADLVETIMERARRAGLDQAREIPNPTMRDDTASTRFWFNAGDRIEISVAWGIFTEVEPPPDWDEATAAAFQQLRDLAAYLSSLAVQLPEEDLLEQEIPVDPDRLQVIAFEASPDLALPSGIPDLTQPPLSWPLSTPLAELARPYDPASTILPEPGCAVLTGVGAAAVVETSRQGNLHSPWVDSETTYGLLLTPLLPDQAGCQTPEPV